MSRQPNYMGRPPVEAERMRMADKRAGHERLLETVKFVGKVAVVMAVVFTVAFTLSYFDILSIGPDHVPAPDMGPVTPEPSPPSISPNSLGASALALAQPD